MADLGARTLKTLFDDIRREFLLAQNEQLSKELLADLNTNLGYLEVQDVLNYIVGVRIFDKYARVSGYC